MPQLTMNIPKELQLLQENFKAYYASKHQQKKLTFHHYHSSLIVVANYPKDGGKNRKHELQVKILKEFFSNKIFSNLHKFLGFIISRPDITLI